MKLPKRGTPINDLKCKVCQKLAKDQPNDIKQCDNSQCPFKEVAESN